MTRILPLAAAALALVLPWAGGRAWADPPGQEPVAILHHIEKDVKVRRAGEFAWETATNQMWLMNRDAVKTGDASSAIIQFYDETVLSVDENSMVIVLHTPSRPDLRKSSIAVPSGSVYGRVDHNADRPVEVVIRTPRGWVKASSTSKDGEATRFHAAVAPNGSLRVASESGKVALLEQGRDRELKPHESISLGAPPAAAGEKSAGEKGYEESPPAVDAAEWGAAVRATEQAEREKAAAGEAEKPRPKARAKPAPRRASGAPAPALPSLTEGPARAAPSPSATQPSALASPPASVPLPASALAPSPAPPPEAPPPSAPKLRAPTPKDGAPL